MKKFFALCFLWASTVSAHQLGGVQIPETVMLKPGKIQLELQGAGIRSRMFVKVYVGAFYADEPMKNIQQALEDRGPKRMHLFFLYDVGQSKLQKGWREGLEANNDHQILKRHQDQIEKFLSMFKGGVHQGDEVVIDYLPGRGTQVQVNARVKGIIADSSFYDLILKTWFGMSPPSKKFQQALLSLSK